MTETEFDKILFQALRENANENNRKLLEGYSDKNIHIFSESFNRKMYHDLKKYGINPKVIIKIKHSISYNKAFISVASAVFILFSVSVAVPEVRAVVWGNVIEWLENNIAIYFGDTGNSSIESAVYPKYIPEGYEKVSENIGESNADIFYSDGKSYINFSYYVSSVSFGADNSFSEYSHVKINDYDGYILKSDSLNILIWQDDKYIYEINAQNSDADLVRIAESLYYSEIYEVK